jgi:hypothetical protein
MSKKQATASEKRYMGRVSQQSCSCCGAPGPSIVHHLREGQGTSDRSSNWLTISVCHHCHGNYLGSQGIHGDKTLLRIYKTSELDMLAKTIENLNQ